MTGKRPGQGRFSRFARITATTMIGAAIGVGIGTLAGVPEIGLTAGTGAGAITGAIIMAGF